MAPNTPDEFAWAHDPSLNEEERWHAMKLWKAKKRVEFTQSARAREEYAAWLARETPSQVEVKLKPRQKQKVFRIS
jgi:hypothetical protein